MKLSLKKYIHMTLYWFGLFLVYCVLTLASILLLKESTKFVLVMVICVIACFFLGFGVYNLCSYISMKKKCKKITPEVGTIFNWQADWNRPFGSVILKVGENEYSTSPYFLSEDCRRMVGKQVRYAIIDDVLFLYELIEE